MRFCRNTPHRWVHKITYCGIIPLFLISMVCIGLSDIFRVLNQDSLNSHIGCVLWWAMTFSASYILIPLIFAECRRYAVSEEGIWIKNIFQKEKLYSWSQIADIGIYVFEGNGSLSAFSSGIFCFDSAKPSKFERKVVRSYFYHGLIRELFAVIDYSKEVFEEIQKYCPYEIVDHRSEQLRVSDYEVYRWFMDQK